MRHYHGARESYIRHHWTLQSAHLGPLGRPRAAQRLRPTTGCHSGQARASLDKSSQLVLHTNHAIYQSAEEPPASTALYHRRARRCAACAAPASAPPANRRWRRQPAGAAARRRTGEGTSDGATEIKSDDPAPPPVQGGDNGRPMTPGDFRRRRSPGGFYGGRGRSRGTKPRALPPRIVGFGAFVSVVL